jgi:hypothetical protein
MEIVYESCNVLFSGQQTHKLPGGNIHKVYISVDLPALPVGSQWKTLESAYNDRFSGHLLAHSISSGHTLTKTPRDMIGLSIIKSLCLSDREVFNRNNIADWLDYTVTAGKFSALNQMLGRDIDSQQPNRIYLPLPNQYVGKALNEYDRVANLPREEAYMASKTEYPVDYDNSTMHITFDDVRSFIDGPIPDDLNIKYSIIIDKRYCGASINN